MSATFKGLPQLYARLNALKKIGRPISEQWALRTVAGAKQRVRHKTGDTGRTIHVQSVTDHGATVVAGGAAVYLEKGTRPHVIRPRRKKSLAWPAKGSARLSGSPKKGGSVIFAKKVNHPGTKEYPFLQPAGEEALRYVGKDVVYDQWNDAA